MRITESQLRKIVRQEVKRANLSESKTSSVSTVVSDLLSLFAKAEEEGAETYIMGSRSLTPNTIEIDVEGPAGDRTPYLITVTEA